MEIRIRKGHRNDIPDILRLVKELARYEKAPGEVEITIRDLENDCFGNNKIAGFFVAGYNKKVVGMALFYTKYSTWKGRCLFLDDIVVTKKYRRMGIGAQLFERVIAEAKKRRVRRLEWQVLDWNKPAILFYRKYKARFMPEWITCRLAGKSLL